MIRGLWEMWLPHPVTTLLASMACSRDNLIFTTAEIKTTSNAVQRTFTFSVHLNISILVGSEVLPKFRNLQIIREFGNKPATFLLNLRVIGKT
jgi:hypothetical protein